MILHRQPTEAEIRRFISSQQDLPFSYPAVGATQRGLVGQAPAGFNVDHSRIQLGQGQETYERAQSVLQKWKQFDLGWVALVPSGQPLEVGTTVAVQAKVFGFWWVNAARIVYTVDEQEGQNMRYGFAYGTLPDHVERGEERFSVEWQKDGDDSVWYDIYAFSRPQHPLVRLGYPLARMLQRRFVRDSLAVMQSVVLAAD